MLELDPRARFYLVWDTQVHQIVPSPLIIPLALNLDRSLTNLTEYYARFRQDHDCLSWERKCTASMIMLYVVPHHFRVEMISYSNEGDAREMTAAIQFYSEHWFQMQEQITAFLEGAGAGAQGALRLADVETLGFFIFVHGSVGRTEAEVEEMASRLLRAHCPEVLYLVKVSKLGFLYTIKRSGEIEHGVFRAITTILTIR